MMAALAAATLTAVGADRRSTPESRPALQLAPDAAATPSSNPNPLANGTTARARRALLSADGSGSSQRQLSEELAVAPASLLAAQRTTTCADCVHYDTSTFAAGVSTYWEQRQHYMYYKQLVHTAALYAPNARSVLDVGSAQTPLLSAFDWIPKRVMLNKDFPSDFQPPAGVVAVSADFMAHQFASKFDLVLCNQAGQRGGEVGSWGR